MNDKTKIGLEILQTAIILGVSGDILLRSTPWGLNVFLWVLLLAVAMTALIFRRRSDLWTNQSAAFYGALIFFSLMYVWRDSAELKVLNFLAILMLLGILVLPALKIKSHLAGTVHYFAAAVFSGVSAAVAPLLLVFDDIKWKTIPHEGFLKHLIPALKGIAIAAPILLIFIALLTAADAVFQGLIEETFRIDPEYLIGHFAAIGMISWVVAGYLRAAMVTGFSGSGDLSIIQKNARENDEIREQVSSVTLHISDEPTEKEAAEKKETREPEKKNSFDWKNPDNSVLPKFFTLGAIETAIILLSLNLLFLSFVIVQIPYLFGGMDLVQTTPDFKLAEYARRGFGELVAVAALVLPILLLSHWLLRKDNRLNEKLYRALAGIQIALLFVIMISAAQRLLLYTGNLGYGLTAERFYPMVFMIWLAMVFVWFCMTVLRGMRQQFAWGALWSGLFLLGTLHVLSPDDFIVRTNINLHQQGRNFDAHSNARLSDDAVPALVESLELLSAEKQCSIKWRLHRRYNASKEETDFRSWNYSRQIARGILKRNEEAVSLDGCPDHYRVRYLHFD